MTGVGCYVVRDFAHKGCDLMLDRPERPLCSLSVGYGGCVRESLKAPGDGVNPGGSREYG